MPYIKPEDKRKWHEAEMSDIIDPIENCGDLNYIFTRISQGYLDKDDGLRYQKINDVIGALECCKQELYRRIAAPYEDMKISENGDVMAPEIEDELYE